jgi:septum formation protein
VSDSTRGSQPEPRPTLVLASRSPRRLDLLASAGIAVDVDPIAVDERRLNGELPAAAVERVARLKAQASAARHPDRPVLGADTLVVLDDDVMGKPADANDAARMLRRLAGRAHEVLTGVAVVWRGELHSFVERTQVSVRPMSAAEVDWYVASGEPMDKAGAYAIQGLASRFVTRVEGSYANVVGLPVASVVELLTRLGLL